MEKLLQITYLYDFYGQLLTDKQEKIIRKYYLEDLSLGEIALEEGVSRQSIHDTIKQGEKKLMAYEQKLGLLNRFKKQEIELKSIISKIQEIQISVHDPKINSTILDVIKNMQKLLND